MPVDEELRRESDRLYERYGKPLEAEHWGEYVAITSDGRTLLAPTLAEALAQSAEVFGGGGFVFKVGPRIAVTLR
ncbi:MAG: hypothetical protein ACRDJE_28800 [Dehalococcoidia bacterium]